MVNLLAAASSIGGLWAALSAEPRKKWVGALISALVLLLLSAQYIYHRMYIDQIENRMISEMSGKVLSLEQVSERLFLVDERDLIEALSGLDAQGRLSSTKEDANLKMPPNSEVRVQVITIK
jgi:hypothetical protein